MPPLSVPIQAFKLTEWYIFFLQFAPLHSRSLQHSLLSERHCAEITYHNYSLPARSASGCADFVC